MKSRIPAFLPFLPGHGQFLFRPKAQFPISQRRRAAYDCINQSKPFVPYKAGLPPESQQRLYGKIHQQNNKYLNHQLFCMIMSISPEFGRSVAAGFPIIVQLIDAALLIFLGKVVCHILVMSDLLPSQLPGHLHKNFLMAYFFQIRLFRQAEPINTIQQMFWLPSSEGIDHSHRYIFQEPALKSHFLQPFSLLLEAQKSLASFYSSSFFLIHPQPPYSRSAFRPSAAFPV